jgi:hypothetical protein
MLYAGIFMLNIRIDVKSNIITGTSKANKGKLNKRLKATKINHLTNLLKTKIKDVRKR